MKISVAQKVSYLKIKKTAESNCVKTCLYLYTEKNIPISSAKSSQLFLDVILQVIYGLKMCLFKILIQFLECSWNH